MRLWPFTKDNATKKEVEERVKLEELELALRDLVVNNYTSVDTTTVYHLAYNDGTKHLFPVNQITGMHLNQVVDENWGVYISDTLVFSGSLEEADAVYERILSDFEKIGVSGKRQPISQSE